MTWGGGMLPYLNMVGRLRGNDPRLFIYLFIFFQSDWVPILYLNTIQLIPSFCRKNRFVLNLSHLVPDILGPKVGLIFTKMYYLTDLKHFVSIFP